MAWTYSGNPKSSDRDRVRFLLSDTHGEVVGISLSDAEVDFIISEFVPVNHYRAAAECAERMAAAFASKSSSMRRVGDLEIADDYTTASERYFKLAIRLRAGRTAAAIGKPIMESTSTSSFAIGMFDDPAVSGPVIDQTQHYF